MNEIKHNYLKHDDFNQLINELLNHEKVRSLNNYEQHLSTSRLEHSLNVAYFAYRLGRFSKLDLEGMVPAALLHDFFLYNHRVEQPIPGNHLYVHPKMALANAQSVMEISPLMENIILSHMWPFSDVKPASKEAWLVNLADKSATLMELGKQVLLRSKRWAYTYSLLGLLLFIP